MALARFDLSSDTTIFFLVGFVLMIIVTMALSRVAPGRKGARRRPGQPKSTGRPDQREGELID